MLHAVIPAGGSGTRLWPLSRAGNPKFLHSLDGGSASLLQSTVRRLRPLAAEGQTYVVTGLGHAAAVARQLPELPDSNLLIEPSPKDSCAAIGLAAALIEQRTPGMIMGSFAADHVVPDEKAFHQTIAEAVRGASRGLLMTVGMRPTHPETGFGYVQCGDHLDGAIRKVEKFKEKPDLATAVSFVESGDYLWNASMFVWRTDVFLELLAAREPQLCAGLREIAAAWDTPAREKVMGEIWPSLKKVAVEYAVMEPAAEAGQVATVPGDFGWSDIGDFRNLGELFQDSASKNAVASDGREDDRVALHNCTYCVVVPRSNRFIATVGLRDVVIVDTDDVLLVCDVNHAQDVREVVARLKKEGLEQYL